jgi:predicted chitinase
MMNRAIFYDAIRQLFGGALTQERVNGFETILNEWDRRAWSDSRHLAYMLATVQHETASTMRPIEEYGKGKGRPYGAADPATGVAYFGRGYVQLTWKENYVRAGAKIGEDLVFKPERALLPAVAVRILFDGMSEGWFAGDGKGRHTLARYFGASADDPVGARRIINGTDRAEEIARLHASYLAAIEKAGG